MGIIAACKVQKTYEPKENYISIIENSTVFNNHFMGFSLYDPVTGETLYSLNSDKYFTPASNTKLFTFYTCLRILGDSIPSLKYTIQNDSLFFTGTGDPSFLHPEFTSQLTLQFLKNRNERIFFIDQGFYDESYGPGWSWDDYHYKFSAEKSVFPIYGNYVNYIYKPLQLYPEVYPTYFNKFSRIHTFGRVENRTIQRSFLENIFSIQLRTDTIGDTVKIPFKYSPQLLVELLSDTLKKEVILLEKDDITLNQAFYGFATDSLYKKMLVESDNFIAEQLMLLCAQIISDTLNVKKSIDFAQDNLLPDLDVNIKWVDGSGLSIYNLFTPQSMIYILDKIYTLVPEQRLFSLLPAGGVSGTIKNWYKAEVPYVFAKTGTLSNVHCLSGYIKSNSGKILIFSFMHNNYISSTNSIRFEMEKVLRQIREEF
jgi:D-alanyl-D-alanine carboxypeptidase/D-alanyl-D-alanine-endopeptidase (penicillin-binding protein 4)